MCSFVLQPIIRQTPRQNAEGRALWFGRLESALTEGKILQSLACVGCL